MLHYFRDWLLRRKREKCPHRFTFCIQKLLGSNAETHECFQCGDRLLVEPE